VDDELEYDLLTELEMVEGESAPEYVNVTARHARLEIERLRMERDDLQVLLKGRTAEFQAEIERLRQRGDKLHTVALEMPNPRHNLSWLAWRTQMDNALMGWEKARRG
jgi:hypothetical protein